MNKWQEALKYFEKMKSKTLEEKINYSLNLIEKVINKHKKYCVACSFGKDSTVMLHLV